MFVHIEEACAFLEGRRHKTTLARFKEIMDEIGLNYNALKMIHVAGTNGKGSTVNDLACILMEAGYQVGTFTSPYILCHNDRICINRVPISDQAFLALINTWQPVIEKYGLSMFESDLLLMFAYFLNQPVDYVIVETGIGGRFDKTNLICPIASVITNIGHDHLASLGPKLTDVAWQKGGIIKEGVPVFCGPMLSEIADVFNQIAQEKNTTIHYSHPPIVQSYPIKFDYQDLTIELGDVGFYQVANACLAIDVVLGIWGHRLDKAIVSGLKKALWPGRFEHFSYEDRDIFLDGAHNLEAMQALIQTVKQRVGDRSIEVVYAALRDKDYINMATMLKQAGFVVHLCRFDDERALRDEDCAHLDGVGYYENFEIALDDWKNNSKAVLLVTGSLHFISYVRHIFDKDGQISVSS